MKPFVPAFTFAFLTLLPTPAGRAALNPVASVLVVSGDVPTPGSGTINSFETPVLSDNGFAVFPGFVSPPEQSSRSGVFRVNTSSGAFETLLLSGQPAADANGNISSFGKALVVNPAGQAGVTVQLSGTLGGALDSMALFRLDNPASPVQIARGGERAPVDGRYYLFTPDFKSINGAGDLVFTAYLRNTPGGNTDNSGIFLSDGQNATQVARLGSPAPGDRGVFSSFGSPLAGPALNESGQVLFTATVFKQGSAVNSGIFLADENTIVEVAFQGGAVPGGNGSFNGFLLANPSFNDRGEAAFYSTIRDTALETADNTAIFRVSPASGAEIARKGAFTPGNRGRFLDFSPAVALNNAGEVLFTANITGASDGSSSGLFIGNGAHLVAVARLADPAPGGGNFTRFDPAGCALNNSGQAVFLATVSAENGFGQSGALFFYDPVAGLMQITRENQDLAGSGLVTRLGFSGGTGSMGAARSGLNNKGEVAFTGYIAGQTVMALWSLKDTGNNLPPVITPLALETTRGQALQFSLANLLAVVTDPEGGPVNITSVSSQSTAGGTVFRNGNQFTYNPPFSFQGEDQLTFVALDKVGLSAEGTIEITVLSPNRPPVSTNVRNIVEFTVRPGEQIVFQVSDLLAGISDPDGDAIILSQLPSTTLRGAPISRNGDTITLIPDLDSRVDSFTYQVADARGATLQLTAQFLAATGLGDLHVNSANVTFSFTSFAATWSIERADSPIGPWNKVGEVVIAQPSRSGGNGTVQFQDTNPPPNHAFYRASTVSSGGK